MYDDILIPTDGSETVDETLRHALPIAVDNGSTVHALYVVDARITTVPDEESREKLTASLEAEGESAVATVAEAAADEGLETVREIRRGTPSKTILDYATENGVDLIVVGTHGKTAREKVTSLGSVSERVVDGASIPVLVVRNAGVEA